MSNIDNIALNIPVITITHTNESLADGLTLMVKNIRKTRFRIEKRKFKIRNILNER